jgi:hypothetical protein
MQVTRRNCDLSNHLFPSCDIHSSYRAGASSAARLLIYRHVQSNCKARSMVINLIGTELNPLRQALSSPCQTAWERPKILVVSTAGPAKSLT